MMFKWSGREYLLIRLKPGLHFDHAVSYRLKQWCGQFGSKYRLCSIWTLKCFVLSYKSNAAKLSWFVYFEQLKNSRGLVVATENLQIGTVKLFVYVKLILLGHVSESRNIVERFAHLDWSEHKLMENLPVVTNASFQPSCVLLTQMILEETKKNKVSLRADDRSGCVRRQSDAKRWLLNLQRGFLQTQFSKDWIYLQEHVVVDFNSSCYDIHWRKHTCWNTCFCLVLLKQDKRSEGYGAQKSRMS